MLKIEIFNSRVKNLDCLLGKFSHQINATVPNVT